MDVLRSPIEIIPQQDSKGSYNACDSVKGGEIIIPQQDSKGSYNLRLAWP